MRVERFEQAHQLAEGQLVVDAKGELWKAIHYLGDVQLIGFEGVENAFIVDQSGQGRPLGPEDDAPLPWLTVNIVPDDDLPRPVLDPCPVCGKADWPEGGMHAARSIHLRNHERAGSAISTMCGSCGDNQQLAFGVDLFVAHANRRTGEPCPGEPGIPTADAAARWRQFCAGLDQPELWR